MSIGGTCLLGMPGLYQNWLLAALDPSSQIVYDNQSNFICKNSRVTWIKKFDVSIDNLPYNKFCTSAGPVINLYVTDENFAWYLYNFLEKTDGIGITVANLERDLFSKAPGTVAFDLMLKHFIESYSVESNAVASDIKNSLIEYFYFLLINTDCNFKKKSTQIVNNAINLEYNDFKDLDILVEKLNVLDCFNKDYFVNLYQDLHLRNKVYLQRKQNFKQKVILNKLDLLETSYVGYLITRHTNQQLDWFNTKIRDQYFNDCQKDFLEWHNN